MSAYIIKRLLLALPALLGAILIVFLLVRLAPGDPATAMAGPQATEEYVQQIKAEFNLDKHIAVQFITYMKKLVLEGELGESIRTNRPVITEISEKFPATLELALAGVFIATVLGIPAGVISATRANTAVDSLTRLGSLLGVSIPVFWLGLMLMLVFAVILGVLPTSGRGPNLVSEVVPAVLFRAEIGVLAEWARYIALPAVSLGALSTALVTRITRSAMLDVLGQDYISTARAKGVVERRTILRHGLKNALIPIVTVIGIQFGLLLDGAVLTETVFAWPGMGRLIVDSIVNRDFPVVQGALIVLAASVIILNLLVDLLYVAVDPRIRYD